MRRAGRHAQPPASIKPRAKDSNPGLHVQSVPCYQLHQPGTVAVGAGFEPARTRSNNPPRYRLRHPTPFARPERFELPTSRFEAWRSAPLSYGRMSRSGGDRTPDLPGVDRALFIAELRSFVALCSCQCASFVDPVGFEPTASWVQARRSSVLELQAHRRDGGTRTRVSPWHGDVLALCTTPTRLFSCSRTGGRDRTPACRVGAGRAPTTPRPFEGKRKGPLLREESPSTGTRKDYLFAKPPICACCQPAR